MTASEMSIIFIILMYLLIPITIAFSILKRCYIYLTSKKTKLFLIKGEKIE